MSKYIQRCKYFEDDGRPIRSRGFEGCFRNTGECWFVHPDQPEWDKLPPVSLPLTSSFRDRDPGLSPTGDMRRSHSKERRPSDSGYSHRNERSTHHSPSRSRDKGYRRRSKSPTLSTTSTDPYEKGRGRDASTSHSRRSRNDDSLRSSDRHRSEDKGGGGKALERRDGIKDDGGSSLLLLDRRPTVPSTANPKPPSMNPPPLPLQPPPPVPPPPSFLSNLPSEPPKSLPKSEPTIEEKRIMWVERIKRMSESIQTRSEHTKLESDIRNVRRLIQSSRYEGLAAEEKASLNSQLKEWETRAAQKKEEFAQHISRLMDSESWPVVNQGGGARAGTDAGTDLKYFEMAKTVAELRDTVTTMNDTINDFIRTRNEMAQEEADVAMDMDGDGKQDNVRPMKRRKTWQGPEESYDEQSRHAAEIIQREISNLRDTLVILEGRLSDLENDRIQQHQELVDEIAARVDSKFEDLDTGLGGRSSAGELVALQEASDKLNGVELNLNTTGSQVDEIAIEVGSLITRSSATDAEVERLTQELQELSTENAVIRETLTAYREMQEKNKKEITALSAALSAHLAQPETPPPSPQLLPVEFVLQAVEAPLLQSVRKNVTSLIETLRSDIANMLQERNAEMYQSLWSKLSLTLRMVEALKEQIGGEEAGYSMDTHADGSQ